MPERHAARATIRRYHTGDASDIRRLAIPEIDRSTYRSAPRAAIDGLVNGTDPDARAFVAVDDDTLVAFIVHGTIAGSEGAGRVQLVITAPHARRAGVAQALVEAAVDDLRTAGARFTMIEMPDDPSLAPAASLLERCGFRIEARVPDFYRDGIDLALFRRDLVRA